MLWTTLAARRRLRSARHGTSAQDFFASTGLCIVDDAVEELLGQLGVGLSCPDGAVSESLAGVLDRVGELLCRLVYLLL